MVPLSNNLVSSFQFSFLNSFPSYRNYIYNSENPLLIAMRASQESGNLTDSINHISQCLSFYNFYTTNKTLSEISCPSVYSGKKLNISQLLNTMLSAYKNCINYQINELKHFDIINQGYGLRTILKAKIVLHAFNSETKIQELWKHGSRLLESYELAYRIDYSKPLADGSTWLSNSLYSLNEPTAEVLEKLMKLGTPLNARDQLIGNTALIIACFRNFLQTVQILINSNHVDVNLSNNLGVTPLLFATKQKNYPLMHLLIQAKANCNHQTLNGITSLMVACAKGDIQAAQILIAANANVNLNNDLNESPLFCAIQVHSIAVVNLLVGAHADLEVIERKGGHSPLSLATYRGDVTIVNRLLEVNANVNFQDRNGLTPLIMACRSESKEQDVNKKIIALNIIEAHANVNLQDRHGFTALMDCCLNKNSEQVASRLIAANADVNLTNTYGSTALFHVSEEWNYQIFTSLIDAHANVNHQNIKGFTPLMIASSHANAGAVHNLIAAKANVSMRNLNGDTALNLACMNDRSFQAIPVLLQSNAEVNVPNNEGMTPLMTTIKNKTGYGSMLLDAKADVNMVDGSGRCALSYAMINDNATSNKWVAVSTLILSALTNETLRKQVKDQQRKEALEQEHKDKKHCPE